MSENWELKGAGPFERFGNFETAARRDAWDGEEMDIRNGV